MCVKFLSELCELPLCRRLSQWQTATLHALPRERLSRDPVMCDIPPGLLLHARVPLAIPDGPTHIQFKQIMTGRGITAQDTRSITHTSCIVVVPENELSPNTSPMYRMPSPTTARKTYWLTMQDMTRVLFFFTTVDLHALSEKTMPAPFARLPFLFRRHHADPCNIAKEVHSSAKHIRPAVMRSWIPPWAGACHAAFFNPDIAMLHVYRAFPSRLSITDAKVPDNATLLDIQSTAPPASIAELRANPLGVTATACALLQAVQRRWPHKFHNAAMAYFTMYALTGTKAPPPDIATITKGLPADTQAQIKTMIRCNQGLFDDADSAAHIVLTYFTGVLGDMVPSDYSPSRGTFDHERYYYLLIHGTWVVLHERGHVLWGKRDQFAPTYRLGMAAVVRKNTTECITMLCDAAMYDAAASVRRFMAAHNDAAILYFPCTSEWELSESLTRFLLPPPTATSSSVPRKRRTDPLPMDAEYRLYPLYNDGNDGCVLVIVRRDWDAYTAMSACALASSATDSARNMPLHTASVAAHTMTALLSASDPTTRLLIWTRFCSLWGSAPTPEYAAWSLKEASFLIAAFHDDAKSFTPLLPLLVAISCGGASHQVNNKSARAVAQFVKPRIEECHLDAILTECAAPERAMVTLHPSRGLRQLVQIFTCLNSPFATLQQRVDTFVHLSGQWQITPSRSNAHLVVEPLLPAAVARLPFASATPPWTTGPKVSDQTEIMFGDGTLGNAQSQMWFTLLSAIELMARQPRSIGTTTLSELAQLIAKPMPLEYSDWVRSGGSYQLTVDRGTTSPLYHTPVDKAIVACCNSDSALVSTRMYHITENTSGMILDALEKLSKRVNQSWSLPAPATQYKGMSDMFGSPSSPKKHRTAGKQDSGE
jgi:hypothetical protein